jgi:hypothetical protein
MRIKLIEPFFAYIEVFYYRQRCHFYLHQMALLAFEKAAAC